MSASWDIRRPRPRFWILSRRRASSFPLRSSPERRPTTRFPAILASRYPLALGRDVLGIGPDEPTLASVLKSAGYATAAFSAANPYISSRFGYDLGFDTFRDFLESEPQPLPEPRILDWRGWASKSQPQYPESKLEHLGPLRRCLRRTLLPVLSAEDAGPTSLDDLRRFPSADVVVEHARGWLADCRSISLFSLAPFDGSALAVLSEARSAFALWGARRSRRAGRATSIPGGIAPTSGPSGWPRHRDEVVSLYDAGIRWVDEQMKNLVATLRRFPTLGRLHLCAHRRPRRGVSRTWRPLPSASPV